MDKDKFNKKTKIEVKWWTYLGWTLPFVALGALIFLDFVELTSWYDYARFIIVISFFAISVFWWWWAIFKIKVLADLLVKIADQFDDVKKNIRGIKKDINEK